MRTWLLIVSGLSAVIAYSSGCSTFSTTTASKVTFDDRLPSAMEEVFATCQEPLTISPGMTSLDLTGGCTTGDLSSTEAQMLLMAYSSASPLSFGSAVPSTFSVPSTTITGLPFPIQNCSIRIDMDAEFEGIDLENLEVNWERRSGAASLHTDFDLDDDQRIGTLNIDVRVTCPSNVSEWVINAVLGLLFSEVEGSHAIRASGMDLDVWQTFTRASVSQITGGLDVDFDLGSLDVDIDFGILPVDISGAIETARAQVEDSVNDTLATSLAALPATVADQLETAIPSGKKLCSIGITSDQLVMSVGAACISVPSISYP